MDWKPSYTLKDGLLNTIKWYLNFYSKKEFFLICLIIEKE